MQLVASTDSTRTVSLKHVHLNVRHKCGVGDFGPSCAGRVSYGGTRGTPTSGVSRQDPHDILDSSDL